MGWTYAEWGANPAAKGEPGDGRQGAAAEVDAEGGDVVGNVRVQARRMHRDRMRRGPCHGLRQGCAVSAEFALVAVTPLDRPQRLIQTYV